MFVKFEANWFGPDARRYRMNREGDRLTYVPDELVKFLPSTAKVVKLGGAFPEVVKDDGMTLRSWDQHRAIADAEGLLAAKAEANRTEELAKGDLKRRRQEHAARMRAAKAAKKELSVLPITE